MLTRRVWSSRPIFGSPFGEFEQLSRDLGRLLGAVAGTASSGLETGVFPPTNITQDDDNFYVRMQAPGINPKDLSISALRNRVTVAGKREIPHESGEVSYHRRERPEGTFNRTVTLPAEIDAERVDARYTDGVVTITLPKVEEAKPRQITVRS